MVQTIHICGGLMDGEESLLGHHLLCVKTGNFGLVFDAGRISVFKLGPFLEPGIAYESLEEKDGMIFNLPYASSMWHIVADGMLHKCKPDSLKQHNKVEIKRLKLPEGLTSQTSPKGKVRIIESGRFVQRFDVTDLVFEDNSGNVIDVKGRIEITVLPEYISMVFEVAPGVDINNSQLRAVMKLDSEWKRVEKTRNGCLNIAAGKNKFLIVKKSNSGQSITVNGKGKNAGFTVSSNNEIMKAGSKYSVSFLLYPVRSPDMEEGAYYSYLEPENIIMKGIMPYKQDVQVEYDKEHGWYYAELCDHSSYWDMENNRNLVERIHISVKNPDEVIRKVPLMFAKDYDFVGITGICPVLRDTDGIPTGITVQISKNWHYKNDRQILYDGPWFHGFTILEVTPGEILEFELTIAYALWGGVPAASHAQLCLIGYAVNQLWDQVAIGSFGESICYDPEMCLGRSMIDDIRPLMVKSMREGSNEKWNWTNNVGGGDFLVYFDEENKRQCLSGMKTFYKRYGPNLTEVHYAGVTENGNISSHITVSSPRCDDINRAYHKFRYDVLKTTPFKRLAFYQLGADGYNNHQFNKMAYGDAQGLDKEWQPNKGGLRYEVEGIPFKGNQPWFSLHDSIPGLYYDGFIPPKGAWANRGIVVRSWNAHLGGEYIPFPFASVYLTEDQIGSANVELVPPPSLKMLQPGDFIECEVELVVLPVHEEDYYGPNEAFEKSLETGANTWEPVFRQAAGNNVDVSSSHGEILHQYPIVIKLDEKQCAEFEIFGGLGYVPVTFVGLNSYKDWVLERFTRGEWIKVDQSVHGNDYWQTDYDSCINKWSITYNVNLDDKPKDGKSFFRFRRAIL